MTEQTTPVLSKFASNKDENFYVNFGIYNNFGERTSFLIIKQPKKNSSCYTILLLVEKFHCPQPQASMVYIFMIVGQQLEAGLGLGVIVHYKLCQRQGVPFFPHSLEAYGREKWGDFCKQLKDLTMNQIYCFIIDLQYRLFRVSTLQLLAIQLKEILNKK